MRRTIGGEVDEDGAIEAVENGLLVQDEEALEDDNGGGIEADRASRRAGVGGEIVAGSLDGTAAAQGVEVTDEEAVLDGAGVIEVEGGAFRRGGSALILVVPVLGDEGGAGAELVLEEPGEPGLAGAGATRDADDVRERRVSCGAAARGGGAGEEVFETGDVIVEIVIALEAGIAAGAHRTGEIFIGEQGVDFFGKNVRVHPWDEESVFAVVQPVADATGIEGDDWERVPHRLEAHESHRLGPDGRDHDGGGLAVEGLKIGLGDEALEGDAIFQAEAAGEFFARGAMIAVAEDDSLEFGPRTFASARSMTSTPLPRMTWPAKMRRFRGEKVLERGPADWAGCGTGGQMSMRAGSKPLIRSSFFMNPVATMLRSKRRLRASSRCFSAKLAHRTGGPPPRLRFNGARQGKTQWAPAGRVQMWRVRGL